MNSLADQLRARGRISDEKYNKYKKQKRNHEQLTQNHLKSKFKGTKGIIAHDETQLDLSKTVNDFKHVAKGMLESDPKSITLIIQKAHDFVERTGNKKRIIWFFYNVRNGLNNCPLNRLDELLKRMFRRNNPKFKLPE